MDRAKAAATARRLSVLSHLAAVRTMPFPARAQVRLAVEEMGTDEWATETLQRATRDMIDATALLAEEWLTGLSPTPPIDLAAGGVVLVIDGVSMDVWLAGLKSVDEQTLEGCALSWSRLTAEPKTPAAMASLFGLARDPTEELSLRDIPYTHVTGRESHALVDLLPRIENGSGQVVRLSLLDREAHRQRLRLHEMPQALGAFLRRDLEGILSACRAADTALVVTTDHGLSTSRSGLSHGRGGVFERAIFRAAWPAEG
jgi:hypothetical protein